MYDRQFPVRDSRTYKWEVEIIDLDSGDKRTATVKSDEAKYAMQYAYERHAVDMIGMTTSTLRDYYIKKYNVLVKEPERIYETKN